MQLYGLTKDKDDVTLKAIQNHFKKTVSDLSADQASDVLGEDSDYDYGRQLAAEFVERLGSEESPLALMNGVPLERSVLNEKKFEEAVLTEVLSQTLPFQKAVFNGELTDDMEAVDYVMNQPNVMPR